MGGTIALDSELGEGSRAHFTLPLVKVTRQDVIRMRSARQMSDEKLKILTKDDKRILLAEDNAINRTIALAVLKKIGFTNVQTAENGRIACEMVDASGNGFDLILMDCQVCQIS